VTVGGEACGARRKWLHATEAGGAPADRFDAGHRPLTGERSPDEEAEEDAEACE